jgi:predicted GIY-YIG superfamily endonuclease
LIYLEEFDSKKEALTAERFYKSLEGGSQLKEKLIEKGILNFDGNLN